MKTFEVTCATTLAVSESQLQFLTDSLSASFKVSDLSLTEGAIKVAHTVEAESAAIQRMTKRFLFISKSLDRDLVYDNEVTISYGQDPQPQLESRGDVRPVHPGFFTLQGDFLRVFHALNAKVKKMADRLGAIEQEYPTVWPVQLFKSINYFNEFPHQVIMCAGVKEDFSSREEFARRYAEDQNFSTVPMDELMANSEYGLEPAVCDCCYFGLTGSRDLPNRFYTCYNKVFRNERSKSNSLDRLTNFSVRDIMFVGDEEFVLESRQTLIEMLSGFIDRLQLRAKIETANDPFFANDAAMKSVFQNTHRLKYELLAEIPHLDKSIAVGSINLHLDFFGRAFDIETKSSQPASSGCIGIGMERMAYALHCQHGPEISEWPDDLISYLEL